MNNNIQNAYFIGHMGLGDVINYIGAIRYLSKFYNLIYILCFRGYKDNLKMIFNNLNVDIITTENDDFGNFLTNINNDNDIIVSGCWNAVRPSKITNTYLLEDISSLQKNNDNDYTVPWSFIKGLYNDINLSLTVYYEYFHIDTFEESLKIYDKVKNYNIVFLHFYASSGQSAYPTNEWSWIFNDDYLIIDPNKNHYTEEKDSIKFNLCNELLNLPFLYYLDIILNSSQLYVIDSSFGALIHLLKKINRVKGRVIIYDRHYPNKTQYTPIPLFFGESTEFKKYILS